MKIGQEILMKHDRQCTVDFSLFFLGFDPIKIDMLMLVKLIHSECIELNCLFMSMQSVVGLIILCSSIACSQNLILL